MPKQSEAKASPRPKWAQPDLKPDEKMIPEGSEEGYPTVRFDPERGQNFHLDGKRQRVYHGAPPEPPTVAETLAAEPSWRDPALPAD